MTSVAEAVLRRKTEELERGFMDEGLDERRFRELMRNLEWSHEVIESVMQSLTDARRRGYNYEKVRRV
jgi:hypothetical protein